MMMCHTLVIFYIIFIKLKYIKINLILNYTHNNMWKLHVLWDLKFDLQIYGSFVLFKFYMG